jgi:hypothetical protein
VGSDSKDSKFALLPISCWLVCRILAESLQEDRQALAKIPTMALARASRALGPGPLVSGSAAAQNVFVANAAHIPAAAMRGLDTRSRLPLSAASAVSTSSAGAAATGAFSGASAQVGLRMQICMLA